MNIGQIARNQRMIYNIVNKSAGSGYSPKPAASSPPSRISAYSGLLGGLGVSSGAEDQGDNFFSSPAALKGTVRQIAQRLYDASFSADASGENGQVGSALGTYTAADPALQAIRKQLGAKVESQQQLYQPDQTALSGNFAQLQALAESAVSRLQTVSLSDETTKKIQQLALQDARNSAGKQESDQTDIANTSSALSQRDRLSMIQEEVQKFAPSKRAAAFNTINRVWENELERIGSYIKEKDADWTIWGDKFDVGILDDYKAGVDMWV